MAIVVIDEQEYRIANGIVRTMSLRDDLVDEIRDPEEIVRLSRENRIPADLLTFSQHLPDTTPKYSYHMEWDNIAAVPVSSYDHWLMKQIHPNTRNKINKSKRAGVRVTVESLNRRLVEGMVEIFNEAPVRRGRPYGYYGRDIESVEREWSRDTGRSDFLVAYYQSEVIGFIQLVYGKGLARTSGTISKLAHRAKAPMNALLAKAVETCAEKRIPFLVYGKFVYGKNPDDSLTQFKRNNGFERFDVPRYFLPISLRGAVGMRLGLHRGASALLPKRVSSLLSRIRTLWWEKVVR